jgi:hypothetical protein
LDEDYPVEVQIKRKELKQEIHKLKQEGKNAILRYDKIIITGNSSINPATSYEKRKRNEKSPEVPESLKDVTPATKKKLTNQSSERPRPNSSNSLEKFFLVKTK